MVSGQFTPGQFTPGQFTPGRFTPRYTLPFIIDLVIITRGEFSLGRTIYPGYSDVSDKVRGELPLGRTVYPSNSDEMICTKFLVI